MAVLFVLFFPFILGRVISVQIATIKMTQSIICFKGSQVDFHNKCVLQSLNIAFIISKSADPDEMQQTTLSGVSSIQRFDYPLSDEFIQVMPLGLKTITKSSCLKPLGQKP